MSVFHICNGRQILTNFNFCLSVWSFPWRSCPLSSSFANTLIPTNSRCQNRYCLFEFFHCNFFPITSVWREIEPKGIQINFRNTIACRRPTEWITAYTVISLQVSIIRRYEPWVQWPRLWTDPLKARSGVTSVVLWYRDVTGLLRW